jgi:hypothetical protein
MRKSGSRSRSSRLFPPCLLAAMLSLPAWPQDAARLDDMQYQVRQLESELAKLKKAVAQSPAAGPKAVHSRADSLLPGLVSRLDSLSRRVNALEARKDAGPAAGSPGAPGSVSGSNVTVTPSPDPAARPVVSPPPAGAQPPAVVAHAQAPEAGDLAEASALRKEMRDLTALLVSLREGGGLRPDPAAPRPVASLAQPVAPVPKPIAAAPAPIPALVLLGDIQIQGERRLSDKPGQDNLDDFWGRLNLGAEYKSPGFQSKANIRIFPEGFGFEPLTGASFDTVGQGALKTQSQPMSRVTVNHAWVRFSPGAYGLRFGRFETQESQSATYGNYIDLGPSGRFLARPAIHNAVEGTWTSGLWSSSLMAESGDRKLNRGALRAFQKYGKPDGLQVSAGYRSNLFDRAKYPSAEILQRFDAGAGAPLPGGWRVFGEAALLQAAGKRDDTPVLLGVGVPLNRMLDAAALETEWSPRRKAAGQDKPFLVNAYARKIIGRARLDAGIFSDPADADAWALSAGLRVSAGLK